MVKYLPYAVANVENEEEFYLATLDKLPHAVMPTSLFMRGPVATGQQNPKPYIPNPQCSNQAKIPSTLSMRGNRQTRPYPPNTNFEQQDAAGAARRPHTPETQTLNPKPQTTGYGRGGKKLGVPTANLLQSLFSGNLAQVAPS